MSRIASHAFPAVSQSSDRSVAFSSESDPTSNVGALAGRPKRPSFPACGSASTALADALVDAIAKLVQMPEVTALRRSRPAVVSERCMSLSPGLELLLEQLHDKVDVYVWKRHGDGLPDEWISPELQQLVREATPGEKYLSPSDPLLRRVVRWSIESCYDQLGLRGVPRFY